MNWWLGTVMVGVASFVATNIDDAIILMIFFGQTNKTFRPHHIFIGQYLGVIALIIASLPGFLGGQMISEAWIGLLGLLPIAIGINTLVQVNQSKTDEVRINLPQPRKLSSFAPIINVAVVTFANGGDNIGIYVPLFASINLVQLVLIIAIFLMGVSVWCTTALALTRQPSIAYLITRHSEKIVPWVLIGLGIYILIDNGTYRLFASAVS